MEGLAFVFDGHISHDVAFARRAVNLGTANVLQELHPGFMQNTKQRIVAEVSPIIEVGNTDGNFRREQEKFG